jgi:hypothetical protein
MNSTKGGLQATVPRPMPRRAALTILEFLACIIAVVGGMWLGALYFGIDVQNVAYNALSQAEVLDKLPEDWRPAPPKDKLVTREQLVRTLRTELGALRSEITALRTGGAAGTAKTGSETNSAEDLAMTKEKTLAYWIRLNDIAMSESALQQDAETTFSTNNAAKVFAIKGRVGRFAAKSVLAVPTEGVDESVVRFARQMALWYDHGGELYERAVRIWETPIGQQARTQVNDEWKQAEQHHRNEARLLSEKAAAVRGSVSRQFGEEFPEFAKPGAPAANAASDGNAG